jgi:hypothetical protein
VRKAKVFERLFREFQLDNIAYERPLASEEKLERRRLELKNGLTDMHRLFLFGKLSGLNDKDAAIAAGYSLSVAENTKQKIWKPQVRMEFERLRSGLADKIKNGEPLVAPKQTLGSETEESAWR